MAVSKERKAELERMRYQRKRKKAIEILGGICKSCGSTKKLEIDHIDPDLKSFSVGSGWSRSDFFEELKKCQLLCSSCHKNKTFGPIRKKRKHGTHAMHTRGKCRCQQCKDFFNQYKRELRARKR
jgi:5-methylcytosine-specific restriction endonuclease McrA